MNELTLTRPLDPKVVYRMLSDDGTFATCLQIICLAAYGEAIYQEDPLEILLRLEEDFHVRVTTSNENKLKAILLVTATDIFYENPEAFRGTCETLTNGDPGIDLMDDLTVPEIMLALYEVELNHGPRELSPAVMAVVERVIQKEAVDLETQSSGDPMQYVWDYLQEQHDLLLAQLTELGIATEDLPPMDSPEPLANAGVSPALIAALEPPLSEENSESSPSSSPYNPKFTAAISQDL